MQLFKRFNNKCWRPLENNGNMWNELEVLEITNLCNVSFNMRVKARSCQFSEAKRGRAWPIISNAPSNFEGRDIR